MALKLHIWWITLPYLARVAIKWTGLVIGTMIGGFLIQ